MSNANHPIWSVIRFAVGWSALYFVLKETASNFDETETKVLIWMAALFGGGEALTQTLARVVPKMFDQRKGITESKVVQLSELLQQIQEKRKDK